jgi:myo-inositol-1(or 4)-monophosphatase
MTATSVEIERAAFVLARELGHDAIELARHEARLVGTKTDALDVVTAADLAIERHFRQRIRERFPDHSILGEEHGLDANDRDWTWVLDPIDGTFNLVTGLPGVATSIALMNARETRVGVVADLALDAVFSSRKGEGLTRDGGWGAEDRSDLGRARLLIDPGHQDPDPTIFGALEAFAELARVVPRLIGSAAVSLATVAFNGGCFVGTGLELWDGAAGLLLVEERGHAIRCWTLEGDSHHHVLAGEPGLVDAFQPAMAAFIEAWRLRSGGAGAVEIKDVLHGPSPSLLT